MNTDSVYVKSVEHNLKFRITAMPVTAELHTIIKQNKYVCLWPTSIPNFMRIAPTVH
jgi:hypothetical protein